jgi:hypothetical protein
LIGNSTQDGKENEATDAIGPSLVKREQFAISLRREKKKELINSKRIRNLNANFDRSAY